MNNSSEKHPQLKPYFIDDSIWSIALAIGKFLNIDVCEG